MAAQTPNMIRVSLQALCNFHTSALETGEERLRAAMAEYARCMLHAVECDGLLGPPRHQGHALVA